MTDFVDIPHVPVLMTGTWNASTGREPITDDDLKAIVEAASSGLLDPGVIKKGHTDPRFNNYLEDGEPAYGQVVNPVIEDGVLYVDYIKVPAELAESMESAYPRVSVELARNVELHDQDGNIKAQFPVALTAVALLGATPPAVKGLSVRASALAETEYDHRTTIVVSQFAFPGGNTARSLGDKLSAAVREAHGGDFTWTYVEDFSDEAVVFVVESESDMVYYRRPYTASADGTVELTGELTPVIRETKWVTEPQRDTTPNVPTSEPALAQAMSEASNEDAPDQSSQEGATDMPSMDKETAAELRRRYGLPNNASHEDILVAVIEAGTRLPRPDTAPGTDEESTAEERAEQHVEEFEKNQEANSDPTLSEGEGETTVTVETPAAPKAPAIDVSALAEQLQGQYVSASAFAAFQQEHEQTKAALAAREAAETKARRDGLVKSWFGQGKIGPDEVKKVREALDTNEDLAVELVGSRAPMFSTREVGHAKLDPEFMAMDTEATLTAAQYEADDAIFGTAK